MDRLVFISTAVLMSCFSNAYCCDLKYTCRRGHYHVINPDPSLFVDARVEGCQTEMSLRSAKIFIGKCQTSNVTLELITAQGYDRLCPLFCVDKQLRRRRAAGTIKSLQFILESIPNGYANYHCHPSGSIFLKNPRPELYYYSIAERLIGGDACQTRHVLRNYVIEIYDCNREGGILFAAGSSPDVIFTQSGQISRQSNTFLLYCESSGNRPVGGIVNRDSTGLKYECFEDGTIIVRNPRTELFKHSSAESDIGPCKTLFMEGYDKVLIFDCEWNLIVFLVLARDPITETLIIRPNNVFIVDCV